MSSTQRFSTTCEDDDESSYSPYFPYSASDDDKTFDDLEENRGLDLDTKLAALKVSSSIVSLVSHTGKKKKHKKKKKKLFVCSGTIIECEERNGAFISTILTSATLIRCPSGDDAVAPDIRVDVYLLDGKLLKGKVSAFDFHYNIATIKTSSNAPLSIAILKHFDDSMLVNTSVPGDMVSSFQLRRHVDMTPDFKLFKLCPGDRVVALGRHHLFHVLMAAPGEFSVDCCDFDCQELLMASCRITENGIGGPLINHNGEVIGINFFHLRYTPFLPINIVSMCLEDLKKHGRVRRPWLGVEVSNLYTASIYKLDNIINNFPSICKGVIVDKVISKSPADCAGIYPNDVVVKCAGHNVGCFLELFGIMRNKVGESVEVLVMREGLDTCLNLTMVVDEISQNNYYKWQIPKKINLLYGCVSLLALPLDRSYSTTWRRIITSSPRMIHPCYTFENGFEDRKENEGLDLDTKLVALKVSQSIVSLVSHTGKKMKHKKKKEKLFVCSGTIIECEERSNKGTFISTILTSATIIRCPSGQAAVAPDIRVDVYRSDGKLLKGKVSFFDFDYNVATIKIRSNAPLPTVTLKRVDDSMPLNPSASGDMAIDSNSLQLRRHVDQTSNSNLFKLCPGDKVVALGRHYLTYELMAAPGEFSVGRCNFDCQELFMASCKITQSGIGGPLVNRYGEVIGINHFDLAYTPFLPINIALKCLEDLRKHGGVRRPWLGVQVTNLYVSGVRGLDYLIQKFPTICKGVIVEEVRPESPADCAGICRGDVIVQLGGKDVRCVTEFFEIMWDKIGESVEVVVMRADVGDCLKLTMVADETDPDKYYKWPVDQ